MYPAIVLTDPAKPGGESDLALRPVALASGGRSEAWLRDFLLAHPAVLPTAAIDPAYADPIPVCRELRTPAGRIDCLFVTRFGGLVVVECKLWRNPQARREMVGQILDYAKELAAWDYADLQREVSIARSDPGTNALFGLVSARYPDIEEAALVDSVSRNLARGRLMLLLAGDGIREGTESIVQYIGRYSGLHLTFGLVEVAGYELPDGRLLVQPRILARTTNIERAVVRVEGPGAELADVLSPEEIAIANVADEITQDGSEVGSRRRFDPVMLEADRRWRAEFVRSLRLDDPAQAIGKVGYGRVFLDLPVPWAWMTAYSARSQNRCGNSLVLKGDPGAEIFEALKEQRHEIEAELSAAIDGATIAWRSRGELSWVGVDRTFAGDWTVDQEATQLEWLLGATNAFVNIFRPRLLQLLPRGTH